MDSRRSSGSRRLVLIGYLVLVLGTVVSLWGERSGISYPRSLKLYDLGTVLGFALIGWGWWSMLAVVQQQRSRSARRPLRIFAIAGVALAAATVAQTWLLVGHAVKALGDFRLISALFDFPDSHPIYKGFVITIVGYLVVSIGFWWASWDLGRNQPDAEELHQSADVMEPTDS